MRRLRVPFQSSSARSSRFAPLALALAALAGPASAAGREGEQAAYVPPTNTALPPARVGAVELSWDELDRVLIDRYAMSREGREALDQLLRTLVVARIGSERGIEVPGRAVERRWEELDRDVRASGEDGGLAAELRSNRVDPTYFRAMLRVAIVQERLTREALGIGGDEPVSGDQQQIWLGQEMTRRGLEAPPPPWDDGVVARCGDVVVRVEDYVAALRHQLPLDELRETCHQLLLARLAEQRLGTVPPGEMERALDREFQRRRSEAEADPKYQGVSYESLLEARGLTVESMRRDPSVRVAALAALWVEREFGEAGLRETYARERAYFDGTYGEAVRGRALVLKAARFKNDMNPRTFDEADAILHRLADQVTDEESMIELVRTHADDPNDRTAGGDTGWITRLDPRVSDELREALFAALTPDGRVPDDGVLLGPLHTQASALLFWLSEARPTPPWEEMAEHVARVLRKRFLDDLFAPEAMATYLD